MSTQQPRRHPNQNGRTPVKRSGNDHAIRQRRRKRRKENLVARAIVVFGSCAALLAIVFLTVGDHGQKLPASDADSSQQSTATSIPVVAPAVTSAPTATPQPTQDPAYLAEMAFAQTMIADPLLILVNETNPMPEDYIVEEVTADKNTGKPLGALAVEPFQQMQSAAKGDGITLRLQSGYRSVSYQQGLFDRQIAKWEAQGYQGQDAVTKAATVVMYPGCSEHNCGLAADINSPDFLALEEGFENTTAFAWLAEHADEYGFILRYPRADEGTTGVIYEPWHWRYVGTQNAAIIKESGLCLEDFLPELAKVASGTSTSDVIKGTSAFQTAVKDSMDYTSQAPSSNAVQMTYQQALDAGLDPEALGITNE